MFKIVKPYFIDKNNLFICKTNSKSYSIKQFIFSDYNTIYFLDYNCKLNKFIRLNEINNKYKDYTIWDTRQVGKNLFICSISKGEAKNLNYDSLVLLFYYNFYNNTSYIINSYKILPYNKINKYYNLSPKMHSFLYKNLNHIYLCWDNVKYIDNDDIRCKNRNEIIQEQKDGKVVWQWELQDHLELFDYIIRVNNSSPHINYITEVDNDHLLVSYRNIGIVNICKSKDKIEWVIGEKRNDLGFKDIPMLQHCIEWMNPEHTKFAIFNNNWDKGSGRVEEIIKSNKILLSDLASRTTSQVIVYDLENKTSKAYDTGIPASPRQGNVVYLGNNIFDINYGYCMLEDANNVYTLGMLQEKNLETNEINLEIKFDTNKFYIRRGI